jgi:hypothetical protein
MRIAEYEAHLADRARDAGQRRAEREAYAEEASRGRKVKDTARRIAKERISLKGKVCLFCGARAEHRHHPDHTRPLDVVLVCDLCHRGLHAGALWGDPPTWAEIWH